MSFDTTALADVLHSLPLGRAPRRLCVALSGGLDSTVLLYALHALRPAGVFEQLRAVHVDHALHPDSASWTDACDALCGTLDVRLTSIRVTVEQNPGTSPEEAARRARYRALEEQLEPGERLCVAHQADDQLETVLLQLLRGAGPAGLAAMPTLARFGHGWLLRPLLTFRRDALLGYARKHGLDWLEDPSNRDPGPARNYLRLVVVPKLRERWPGAPASVARSARLCAESQVLLAQMGAEDLDAVRSGRTLEVEQMLSLSEARQRNLIRVWLTGLGVRRPDSRRLQSIVVTVIPARRDACPEVRWPGGAVRRYRGRLYALDKQQLAVLDQRLAERSWHPPAPVALDTGLGRLEIEAGVGPCIDPSRLAGRPVAVRFRAGGEALAPVGSAHRRSLKKLFQEAGIPPWWRDRVPLVFAQDRLVAVADLWIDKDLVAAPGQTGWRIRWRDRPDFD